MAEHDFPYTEYESGGCSLGCMMRCMHRVGVKLAFNNGMLELLDKNNFVLDSVKILWAESATYDDDNRPIKAYLISAGTRNNFLVVQNGNGEETLITIPYAETAKYTVDGDEINAFIKGFAIDGDQVRITLGNGNSLLYTIPYATKAFTDVNSKPLTTYAAELAVAGNDIVLKDGMGTVINTITVHYSERAAADENGNNIRESYANSLQTGTQTLKLISKSGDILSEITCPYSTTAARDLNGNEFLHDYAESLVVDNDGKRLDLLAHDGTLLSAVTVPWATLALDAQNAIERVEIVGDQIVFTTYGGVVTRCTIPYSIRALKDNASNEITKTYVHNVVQDPVTGEISFYDAENNVLCSFVPNSRIALYDDHNNYLADFIKNVAWDSQNKYVKVTNGQSQVTSFVVEYAQAAWKDDLTPVGNIIKNVYVKTLFIEEDNEGRYNLVALNGEGSEIHRLILPELVGAADGGIVVNNHQLSLTNEVQSRIYDFTYNALDEEIEVSVHTLTEP